MPDEIDETKVLSDVIAAFRSLPPDARKRLLQTVATFFDLGAPSIPHSTPAHQAPGPFSQDRSASPKEFLHDKNPESETERLVCLAYYLTHYRSQLHFKTLDLTQLNTEAAQIKFSNASATMHSAAVQGLIGPAPDGQRQITARGERFVTLLPDREAARSVLVEKRARRRKRKAAAPKAPERP